MKIDNRMNDNETTHRNYYSEEGQKKNLCTHCSVNLLHCLVNNCSMAENFKFERIFFYVCHFIPLQNVSTFQISRY